VIAGAALVGGMIGGFAIYAIDSALTWEPVSQPRPDARAEGQASAVVAQPQTTKPVRIVGGAIPDPSAGMSAPPPAPQQRNATSPAQISPQLLTPKPLGPASQLQPQTATAAPTVGEPQPQNQTATQGPVSTQATIQQRWPDALSRAHQNPVNAANANSTQQPRRRPPLGRQANALQVRMATPIANRQAAIAPRRRMTRIAATRATAVTADATGAGMMTPRPRHLHRAGRTRGVTIAFMIPTATARTARTAIRANNPTATPEAIGTTPLRGPTCRALKCAALDATHAIEAGGIVKTATATRRSRQVGRGPSRSGAAAFSAAATGIRTTTKAKQFLGCFGISL
jgi:hypothetical protein